MLNNYRTVSNHPCIAEIIEKVVFNQLSNHLNSSGDLKKIQSAFWPHHSMENGFYNSDIWINDIRLKLYTAEYWFRENICSSFTTSQCCIWHCRTHRILLERLEYWIGLAVPKQSLILSIMNLIGWLGHVESPRDQFSDLFCSIYICCLWVKFYRTTTMITILMKMVGGNKLTDLRFTSNIATDWLSWWWLSSKTCTLMLL